MIDAHAFGTTCLSWEPYSKDESAIRFISGGNDNKLKIWSISHNKIAVEKMIALEGHSEAVTDVAWFNDINGKSMIASSGKVN